MKRRESDAGDEHGHVHRTRSAKSVLVPILAACIGVAGGVVLKGWDRAHESTVRNGEQTTDLAVHASRIDDLYAAMNTVKADEIEWRDDHKRFTDTKIEDFQRQINALVAGQNQMIGKLDAIVDRLDKLNRKLN